MLRAISSPPASSTVVGTVELATDTEAKAVSSQALATTPGNLAAVFAEPPALGGTTPAAVTATTVQATGAGTASVPALRVGTGSGQGIYNRTASILGIATAGVERVSLGSSAMVIRSDAFYSWSQSTDPSAGPDVFLARDAANTVAQRNGTNAQTWRIYNTFTDASNYERLSIVSAAATDFKFIPEAAGTGTLRGLQVGVTGGKLGFYGTTAVTKPAALTAADAATVDATYGSEESGVINNLRTRLGELESRLQSLGLLT